MKTHLFLPALLLSSLAPLPADDWPAWRGDLLGSGRTSETRLPREWGPKKNLRWRIELPARGNSTPIVHGDKIFVTQSIKDDNWRGLMCFSRENGALLWKKGVTYAKKERTHTSNPYCSASPSTDGEIVAASYGSAGISAYDLDGKQLWHRNLGAIDHIWGNSTSPVIHADIVIHYHGPAENAVLYGLDRKTGETRWQWREPAWKPGPRTDGFEGREDKGVIGSWSTPIIVTAGEREELVMSFPMEMKAFDPATGKVLWTCSGLNPLVYTSPAYGEGVVIAMGGYKGNSIAVRTGGNGDVTNSHRLWHIVQHNGGIGTGVTRDGHYYYSNPGGTAYCLDILSGKTVWEEKLPGKSKSWGSFVLSGDNIYTLSQSGETVVFKATTKGLDVIAHNKIDEETNSSPVISNGDIFLRTWKALWCFAAE